jgi:hypothetical protein
VSTPAEIKSITQRRFKITKSASTTVASTESATTELIMMKIAPVKNKIPDTLLRISVLICDP